MEKRLYGWLLTAVTVLALILRVIALNSDLWLDELSPVINARNTSVLQTFLTRYSFNIHLLNTLLVKASIAAFGEREWAIRLPAMLFGTATIPALYWVARRMFSRHASLCAALLLAVSYHHIFFSQNARGYTGYLLFSLVSSVLLVEGLRTDSLRAWIGFVVASVLNFAALLISAFVFAAHILVSAVALIKMPVGTGERGRMFRRTFAVFGAAALLGGLIYSPVLAQMFTLLRPTYTDRTSGFSFSFEMLAELARSLGAGFGPGLLIGAIPLLCLAAAGYVILVRRHWMLAMALTLPCILQAAFFAVEGLTFYPRMFILALPLTILVAVQAITSVADAAARALNRAAGFATALTTIVVLLMSAASLTALPRYYSTPKQPYRAALAHVEAARRPDGIVIEIHYAEAMKYYRERAGIMQGIDYFQARTVETLDSILEAHPGRPVWLVTSFPKALRQGVPDLDARIKRDWDVDRTFDATVGDGDIYVWKEKRR